MSLSSAASATELAAARYGKDKVRVFRIVRGENGVHDIVEYEVCALVEGDIATSFTQADNSVVVATDSIKNITYYLAKTSPREVVLSAELFAIHLGAFLLGKYAHLHRAYVDVQQLRWQRIDVDGKPHKHSFWRDGDEKRVTSVEVIKPVEKGTDAKDNMVTKVVSGIKDLLVLKSTGSAFENFVRDEFTTLVEVNDRIFSTSVDLSYTFKPIPLGAHSSLLPTLSSLAINFPNLAAIARQITLSTFATDESASVQATLYKMANLILEEDKKGVVERVRYVLPNKHYVPVDMRYVGVDNLTPANAEVFQPLAHPSGLISATVART